MLSSPIRLSSPNADNVQAVSSPTRSIELDAEFVAAFNSAANTTYEKTVEDSPNYSGFFGHIIALGSIFGARAEVLFYKTRSKLSTPGFVHKAHRIDKIDDFRTRVSDHVRLGYTATEYRFEFRSFRAGLELASKNLRQAGTKKYSMDNDIVSEGRNLFLSALELKEKHTHLQEAEEEDKRGLLRSFEDAQDKYQTALRNLRRSALDYSFNQHWKQSLADAQTAVDQVMPKMIARGVSISQSGTVASIKYALSIADSTKFNYQKLVNGVDSLRENIADSPDYNEMSNSLKIAIGSMVNAIKGNDKEFRAAMKGFELTMSIAATGQ